MHYVLINKQLINPIVSEGYYHFRQKSQWNVLIVKDFGMYLLILEKDNPIDRSILPIGPNEEKKPFVAWAFRFFF